ncbi:MAG TPA: hypothetical protein VE035_16265 [Puia sp.]|nr:hypothetical protein [Puia sp.]
MKKILVVATALFFSQQMFAQDARQEIIPRHIVTAHSAKYPDVKVEKWQPVKEGYQARFNHNGKLRSAYYAADGAWRGTESRIKWTKHLPEKVQTAWASSGHINWKVNTIKLLETPERHLYVLHVSNGSLLDSDHHDAYAEDRALYFTADGELVKKERI